MKKSHPFQVAVSWSGARQGTTQSYTSYSREFTIQAEGKESLICSSDKMFRGEANLYNPEDLFISTISSCHLLWYLHLCADKKIEVISYQDKASGILQIHEDGSGQFLQVDLYPQVVITREEDIMLALQLHEKAHEKCFIANSVNFPVNCKPTVTHQLD